MVDVIVYSAPNCPWCVIAKKFLKDHNIDFKEIDVSEDEAAAKEMMQKSGQMGVPVIAVDDNMIVGFNEAQLKKVLKIK